MSTMEKNFESEDLSIICCLPEEIIIQIFAVLPLQDRKSIRLSCKSWYEFATRLSITKNEKLVFRMDSDIEDIAEAMQNSKFSNFEFQGVPIDSLPANIWEVCGRRISSLEFFECIKISVRTMKNIVIHCENLISFTFRDCESLGWEIFSSLGFLHRLVEKGIQRTKLRTIAMLIHRYHPKRVDFLSELFLVYPCITHFAVVTMFPIWYSYLPVSIESLTFERTLNSKHSMEMLIAKSKQGLRLRHLDGKFDGNDVARDETFFNFFSSQRRLNAIRLLLPRCRSNGNFKRVIFHILENCPNLQEFHINFDNSFSSTVLHFELEELSRFLTLISKLRSLGLGFKVFGGSKVFLPKTIEPSPFCKMFALTSLELTIPKFLEEINELCVPLLQKCPQLLHLKLNSVSDYMLQMIFEYLPKLQTLSLVVRDSYCSDYGFTGCNASISKGYSIKRLQQLKYLSIRGFYRLQGIEDIVLEFQFPYLECLELEIDAKMLSEEVFIHLSTQVPSLRQLHIFYYTVNVRAYRNLIFNFSKYFKNLQCLFTKSNYVSSVWNEFQDFVVQQIEEFSMYSNLRYFSNYGHPSIMFCLDPLTRKVEKRDLHKFKFKCYNDSFRVPPALSYLSLIHENFYI